MAVFRFDDRHKAHVCNPPRAEVHGELDPSTSGAGDYQVVIETENGVQIAGSTASSPDGQPVAVKMAHTHAHPRENVHVVIDGERITNFAVPICLAT